MLKRVFFCSLLGIFMGLAMQTAQAETGLPKAAGWASGQEIEGVPDAGNDKLSQGFDNPSAIWLIEVIGSIVCLAMLVFFIRQSVGARTLTFGMLLFISSVSMFWQEWYADWGAYLLYNPKFALTYLLEIVLKC